MSMSRKDYTAFAAIVRWEYDRAADQTAREALERVASEMAVTFKQDNGRFDRTRFLAAALG